MYFNSPRDFTGFRDKPSGAVLLEECNVRTREASTGPQQRAFMFVLSHGAGESVVLAADSEKEMLEWMQAVRTSRMCIVDAEAGGMPENVRREMAEQEVETAMQQKDEDQRTIGQELDTVHNEHRQVEMEKERAEKELKELMARFKLRKSLLHWRHRKLTFSFRALITIVFRQRIEGARHIKDEADARMEVLSTELDATVSSRQKAEAAKKKSEEMLQKELQMKKEGEADSRDCERVYREEATKAQAAQDETSTLGGSAPNRTTDSKDKNEVLELNLLLEKLKGDAELMQHQIRRKTVQLNAQK